MRHKTRMCVALEVAVLACVATAAVAAETSEPAQDLPRIPVGGDIDAKPAQPADEPPPIPVGYDAFRQWDKWAYLRIGQRTYMTSTYDRRGGNEGADASHFLYQLADDRNVSIDVAGPGVLVFARYNHWHGSPWHYTVDGHDYLVQESSTPHPEKPVENSVFLPEKAFPNPLTWTWSQTRGADLSWVAIPFEKWFTMAYGRTRYGTGYYIYQKFVTGAKLSGPIKSWTPDDEPPKDVISRVGSGVPDIRQLGGGDESLPQPKSFTPLGLPVPPLGIYDAVREELSKRDTRTTSSPATSGPAPQFMWDIAAEVVGMAELAPGQKFEIWNKQVGPKTINMLRLCVPENGAAALGEARLRVWWDGSEQPSVNAPVKLLFGTGSLYNRDNREYLVKSFPTTIRFREGWAEFLLFFPMPFMSSARIELEAADKAIPAFWSTLVLQPYKDPPNWVGYFHATYVDHGKPEPGRDLVFLDTTKVEGGGDWCGHFVGTSFIFSDNAVLNTLEGDPRFYFDDSNTPQAQGTGTEEWGGGGDYWGGRTMTLPLAGHPVGARSAKEARSKDDLVNSAYRFLLSDLFPFGRNARITFEHGGEDRSVEHYQSVTFWYGRRGSFLKPTDTLHVGDPADEKKHEYVSPTASDVQTLSSRYECGLDHMDGQELFPETTDTGRYMTGTSTFVLNLEPRNLGVMLRRKFDYQFPNQCARVSVADAAPNAPWKEVGTWYTAGSNRVIYSNPRGELGKTEHNVQVSNRRWREDEFLLPRDATAGRSSIRVKIDCAPRNIPLFPGDALAQQAWSEYRYSAYCFVMP